jgi:ferritin-like metal-binding protein YciE
MQTIHNLPELLAYSIQNLFYAEEEISQFIPGLIEKANHRSLKNALKHHADLTAAQKDRLIQIASLLNQKFPISSSPELDKSDTIVTNKAIKGLVEEIEDLLHLNLSHEVIDAAIISSVQKIEHYEICTYGTALAYARQLKFAKIDALLNETLQEEYDADDLLTTLANAAINKEGVPTTATMEDVTHENDAKSVEGEGAGEHNKVSISERTINSPGGRAGTSHRGYSTGESRGH